MNWKVTLKGSNPAKRLISILMELTGLESTEVVLALKKGSLVASSGISKERAEKLSATLSKHRGVKCTLLPVDDVDSRPVRFRVVLVECEVGKRSRLRRKLQELAGIHHEQAVLWLSKLPFVIKKHVDNDTARKIKNAIMEAGGIVRIEPELESSKDNDTPVITTSAVLFEKEDIESVDENEFPSSITDKVNSPHSSPIEEELNEQQMETPELVSDEEHPDDTNESTDEIPVNPEDIPDKCEEKQKAVPDCDTDNINSAATVDSTIKTELVEDKVQQTSLETEPVETAHETDNSDISCNGDEIEETVFETKEEVLESAEGVPEGNVVSIKKSFRQPPKPAKIEKNKKVRTVVPCIFIPGKPPNSAPPVEFTVPPIFAITEKSTEAPPVIQMCTPLNSIEYCIPPILSLEKARDEIRRTPPPAIVIFGIPQTRLSGMNTPPSRVPDMPKQKPVYGIISPPPIRKFRVIQKRPLASCIPVAEHEGAIPAEVPALPEVSFEPTAPPPVVVFLREPELPLERGIPAAKYEGAIPEEVPALPEVSFEPTAPPPEIVFLREPELPLERGIPAAKYEGGIPEEIPDLPEVSFEPTAPPPVVKVSKEVELIPGVPQRTIELEVSPPFPEQKTARESGEQPPTVDFVSSGTFAGGDSSESDLIFEIPPADMPIPPDSAKYSIYLCAPSEAVSEDVALALQDVLLFQKATSIDMLRDCPSWIASFQSIEKAREIAGKLEKRGATVFLDSREPQVCR